MNRPSSVRRAAIRLPSTEGLRAFEAVARLGSFERAAHELSLTASAVSKRVSSLEEVAGTSLFTRKANALVLTDAGMDYATRSSEVLRQLMAMPQHGRVEIRNGDVAASGGILLMQDVVTPLVSPDLLLRLPPLRVPGDLRHAPLIRTPLEPWSPWFHSALLDWPETRARPKVARPRPHFRGGRERSWHCPMPPEPGERLVDQASTAPSLRYLRPPDQAVLRAR